MHKATHNIRILTPIIHDLGGETEYYYAEVTQNGRAIGGVHGDRLANDYGSSLPDEAIFEYVMGVIRERYEFVSRKLTD